MKNVSLLVDENFPHPAIAQLRTAGVSVLAICDLSPGISDAAVLRLAIEHNAWLVTFDLDFGELIFQNKLAVPKTVVIFREKHFRPHELSQAIMQMLAQNETFDHKFVLWTRERIRLRPLPSAL